MKRRLRVPLGLGFWILFCACVGAWAQSAARFQISFPAKVHAAPITGRIYLIATRQAGTEPRLQVGEFTQQTPFFGADVQALKPGESAAIDETSTGYPLASLRQLPEGDYYVQAVVNVYTEFHRADGHVIWAHNDQWEGQQFNLSPGNLYSEARKVHLPLEARDVIKLVANQVIPPIKVPPDSQWVKHIKFESKLLSRFWGQPMYLGATILLPKDYEQRPKSFYPVIYEQGHFGLEPPLFMQPDEHGSRHGRYGRENFQQWSGPAFPRMIAVTFQHPTLYFDDSYAVNSANNGPYGDAIMQELIPYIEEHFRIIRQPWARELTGGSTGGWESLALQLYHPDFFGGTWTFFPDPVDFRKYQLIDIYRDQSAFEAPGAEYVPRERPLMRTSEGQVTLTVRQMSQLEEALGSHGRSGQQLEAWEAVYGPVGSDGYPQPLWDKRTGKIDRHVATYMRDHGYDLRYYAEKNWERIGPELVSKIHIYCGDMDNFYLNVAVAEMENFLNGTDHPSAQATFAYGRPFKGHGWSPFTPAQLVVAMADYVKHHAPAGTDVNGWSY